MKIFVTAFFTAFGFFCLPANAIIGGSTVSPEDPIAKTTVQVWSSGFCTGSLIANNIVVTAAHCVAGAQTRSTFIAFSTDQKDVDFENYTNVRFITGYKVHPRYSNGTNDIAVIRFKGGLPGGYSRAKLLPNSGAEALALGEEVTLAGYGMTDERPKREETVLRKVNVTVSDNSYIEKTYVDQTRGKGACHGDSGGPAYTTDGFLWGVASHSTVYNSCADEMVYFNILAYIDWVAHSVRELNIEQY